MAYAHDTSGCANDADLQRTKLNKIEPGDRVKYRQQTKRDGYWYGQGLGRTRTLRMSVVLARIWSSANELPIHLPQLYRPRVAIRTFVCISN